LNKIFGLALGILAAIGGFVDIGDLVFNVAAGATFGYQLLWVIVIGVIGIITYSEMCGRVSAVSGKAVFDAVRERTGFKAGLITLIAAEIVNAMTLTAEVGGVAICLQLLSGLPYRLLIVLATIVVGIVVWVMNFNWIERIFGYGGLCPARLRGRGGEAPSRLGRRSATASSPTSPPATSSSSPTSRSACSARR